MTYSYGCTEALTALWKERRKKGKKPIRVLRKNHMEGRVNTVSLLLSSLFVIIVVIFVVVKVGDGDDPIDSFGQRMTVVLSTFEANADDWVIEA